MTRTKCRVAEAVAVAFLVVSGCQTDSDGGGEPPAPAQIRVADANSEGLAFDVCYGNNVILENARFGEITEYAEVDSGNVTLASAVAGSNCDDPMNDWLGEEVTISLGANSENTAVVLDGGESGFVLRDDNSPTTTGRARVRLVNASPDSLSLTVRESGGTILFALVRYDETADYDYVDVVPATYDLEVVPQAGEQTPIAFDGVQFETGKVYTLFAVGNVGGDGEPFDLAVVTDSSPGEEAP